MPLPLPRPLVSAAMDALDGRGLGIDSSSIIFSSSCSMLKVVGIGGCCEISWRSSAAAQGVRSPVGGWIKIFGHHFSVENGSLGYVASSNSLCICEHSKNTRLSRSRMIWQRGCRSNTRLVLALLKQETDPGDHVFKFVTIIRTKV